MHPYIYCDKCVENDLTKIIRFQGLGNLGKKMHLYSLCYYPGEFNVLLSTQSKDVKEILGVTFYIQGPSKEPSIYRQKCRLRRMLPFYNSFAAEHLAGC